MQLEWDENIKITFRDIMRDMIEMDSRIPKALLDFREYLTWKILSAWRDQDSVKRRHFDVRDSKTGDFLITQHTYTKVVGIVPKNYRQKPIRITIDSLRRELEAFEPTKELLELSREIHG